MIAFYSDGTRQVKAYDRGSDWQLLDGKSERWFSTWSNDRRASLQAAFSRFLGHDVNQNEIHGLKDIKA